MTLIDSGQLPPTPHFPETIGSWNDLKSAILELIVHEHPHKTFVLDTLNGAARLAVEDILGTKFGNDYERFDAFGKSGERTLPHMIELTNLLNRLREKGMAVLLLAHSVVKNFKNPEGVDFPRWELPLAKEVHEHFDRWCDAILFGRFEVFAEKEDKKALKGKGTGGQSRVIMTENHATYTAGNRFGLPTQIECGTSAKQAWTNFVAAMREAKAKATQPPVQPQAQPQPESQPPANEGDAK